MMSKTFLVKFQNLYYYYYGFFYLTVLIKIFILELMDYLNDLYNVRKFCRLVGFLVFKFRIRLNLGMSFCFGITLGLGLVIFGDLENQL